MTVVAHTRMVTDNALGTIQRCLDSRVWPPTLIDSQWPPYNYCGNVFPDAGDLGLSVLLTAWDDWRVGVMRKIRLPLRRIAFQNMSLVHPGNVFEINLEFEWEVYTNTEGRRLIARTIRLLADIDVVFCADQKAIVI